MINVYSVSFAKVQWVSRNTLNQKQTNGPNPSTVYHPLSKCRQFFCWSYFTNLEVNPPPKIAMETAAFLREDFSSGPSDRHLAKVAVPRICKSWRLLFSWEFFYKSIELTKKLSFYTNKRGITHIYIYIYMGMALKTVWIVPRWSGRLERGGYVKGHDPEVSKAPTRRSCFHDMTSYLYMSLWLGPRSHGKAERSSYSVHTSDSTWL